MKNSKIILSLIILIISCKKYSEDQVHPNLPPIAKAGADQIIVLPTDSVLLDGSLSFDSDGQITEWRWTKISGSSFFMIINTNSAQVQVKNLTAGIYQFELKVSDTNGLVGKDTIQIEVKQKIVYEIPGNVVFYCPDPTGTIKYTWQTWDNGDPVNGLFNLITIKINNQSGTLAGIWCKDGCAPRCPIESDYSIDPGNYASFVIPPGIYTWSAENTITNFSGWPGVTPEFAKFFGNIQKAEGTITVNEGDTCIIEPIIF